MPQVDPNWPVLVGLQQRALEAADQTELAFLMGNETWHLVPYRQAAVFLPDAFGRPRLTVVSGLVSTLEDTPLTLWLADVREALASMEEGCQQARRLVAQDLPPHLREGWAEWWPEHALWAPLTNPSGQHLGGVFYVRDEVWSDAEIAEIGLLHRHYAHCLNTFPPRTSLLN